MYRLEQKEHDDTSLEESYRYKYFRMSTNALTTTDIIESCVEEEQIGGMKEKREREKERERECERK